MEYRVLVEVPTLVTIDAVDEEDAIGKVKADLINNGQIKPADPIKITVVMEVKEG